MVRIFGLAGRPLLSALRQRPDPRSQPQALPLSMHRLPLILLRQDWNADGRLKYPAPQMGFRHLS